MQLGDGVVVASRFGRNWLLARHRGRAVLVSTHAHGHRLLDWIVLLDPVASEAMGCWILMAEHVQGPHQGWIPQVKGQRYVATAWRSRC